MVSSDPEMKRWFSPYLEYQPRNRRSQAPVSDVTPRYVLLEKGKTLQHLLRRYQPGIEAISAGTFEQAIEAMSHSPAQALLVNMPPAPEAMPADRLTTLPYNTPVITCWLPGEDEVASQLGVVRYLLKPVSREALLAAVERLGPAVKNVLLVDDEPEMLRLFTRMLASAPKEYHLLQATSGRRALDLLRDRKPDVILLDLMMPGMDGFQVLRAKSQDAAIRQIPTILVSARDPGGEPVVSSTLTVTRTGGLTGRELLECVQAVSEILSPSHPRGQQGEPPG
jgi:CheY-like chemotaxis protein